MIPDGENSADPRYRGRTSCVASFQLRRVSGRFVSSRVRCLRSAGRMRVCQIRIGRFRQGSGMLYLETKYGTCKLASLIETDTDVSPAVIQEKAKAATCVKNISSPDFLQGALFRAMVPLPQDESSVYARHRHYLCRNSRFPSVISIQSMGTISSDTATTMRCPLSCTRR